jgi:hypothetical protein
LVRGSKGVFVFIQPGTHGDHKAVMVHQGRDPDTMVFGEDQPFLFVI